MHLPAPKSLFHVLVAGLALFAPLGLESLWADDAATVFDVPRLDNIVIDGKADDWADRGFRVDILGDEAGRVKASADLDARFRISWDDRGLLLLINVVDDVADEAAGEFWVKDSIELFYSPQRGSHDIYQAVISPGVDPRYPELRYSIHDNRITPALKQINVPITAVRTKTPGGYCLEVLLPWQNLGIKPEMGGECAFQLYVNDADGGKKSSVLWYPRSGAGDDSMRMQALRFADQPSPPVNIVAAGDYERLRRVRIQVAATADLAGKVCKIKDGDRELGSAPLTASDGRAEASFVLPMPAKGTTYGPIAVTLEGQLIKTINLPNPQAEQAQAFMDAEFCFNPSVFIGSDFPPGDFAQPAYVDDLIGPYTITKTFYDAGYNRVTAADKPGRYGAVVEIKTEDGKTYRRLRTLFRMPESIYWWEHNITGTFQLPKETGILPSVISEQANSVDAYLKSSMISSFSEDSETPALFSALYEAKPGATDSTLLTNYQAVDRQWWVGVKRKLDGADQVYPKPFVCPQVLSGQPSTMIHEGSLKEAGMKPGTVEKLDAVLKQWSGDTDQAFAVCVVRHGVVVLHKAYGLRDGKPMTVDTPSWMASLTKAFSGASMMMLVDQGLVSLDDPVSKFFPAFRNPTVPVPLTVRHLYTHTGGLDGHWGDRLNDLDDLIAGEYPYLEIGKELRYDEVGPALGSKILESVSGETLPLFYKHHLFDPLGCTHTTATDSGGNGNSNSTPMDMAKFGQMLLNRGSYGNKQFMRPETFAQMLPEKLTKELGPDTTVQWGIGLIWGSEGLGKGTFGHGAASGALFRVDPEHDMVVVITRNAWGANLDKYQNKFLGTLVDNLQP